MAFSPLPANTLTLPGDAPWHGTDAQRQASAWLFDAVALAHPGFVDLAMRAGAVLDARVWDVAGNGNPEKVSVLMRAVRAVVAQGLPAGPTGPSNAAPAGETVEEGPSRAEQVVDRLVHAGAHDPKALRAFPLAWTGQPVFHRLAHHSLDGVLRERAGSPVLALTDRTQVGEPRCCSVLAADHLVLGDHTLQRPATSWMTLAVRYQREDVIDHLIAQGVPINRTGLTTRVSPLATAWRDWAEQRTGHDRILRTMVRHWQAADDAVYHHEMLHLMTEVMHAERQAATTLRPDGLAKGHALLNDAFTTRPPSPLVTDAAGTWWHLMLGANGPAQGLRLAHAMETASLNHTLQHALDSTGAPVGPPGPRRRL